MTNAIETIKLRVENFRRILDYLPEVRYLGDPILRTKCEEVGLEEGLEIGHQLGEILKKYRTIAGFGRGFAAPQAGLAKKVFVTYLNDEIQIYINPIITKTSSEQNLYRELCLSTGIMTADVKRHAKITMQWTNNKGVSQTKEATDVLARLWQHEYAHLLGIPHLDQAEPDSIELSISDPLQEKIRPI